MPTESDRPQASATPKTLLLVAVRGWTPAGDFPPSFVSKLKESLPHAEVFTPALDLGTFSMRSAESLSKELFRKIDQQVSATIEQIVILGYSSGSLLARRVFCMAHGADVDGTISAPPARWAALIDRVVVLSGITRGWEFSSAAPAHVRFFGPLLQGLTRLVGGLRAFSARAESSTPFIWQLKRGAPFVVATRIQYINVFEMLRASVPGTRAADRKLRAGGLPSTVFLVGARDEYISPADCTELGPRIEFAFGELAGSNHTDVLQIDAAAVAKRRGRRRDEASERADAEQRRLRLIAALTEELETLNRLPWAVPAGDIDDYLDPMDIAEGRVPEEAHAKPVEHAVIVVHGIRDNGFWTKRVAREIKAFGRARKKVVRAPTPTYGYFSMWDFVKPGGRKAATYWFMERYADVKSHFPRATISFVGHSNGTYIAAHAMELCSAIKFENVVFAGSVVKRKFGLRRVARSVKHVLNYVGSGDGVVAFLPGVFEALKVRMLDVGGAGAFGFAEGDDSRATPTRIVHDEHGNHMQFTEYRYVSGGHGAAITEEFWPEIAAFVLTGDPPRRSAAARQQRTSLLFSCAPVVTVLGMVVAALFIAAPLIAVGVTAGLVATSGASFWLATALGVVALAASSFVSWVVGRFLRAW